MNIEEIKKSATAGELCLIEKVLELDIAEAVRIEHDRYIRLLESEFGRINGIYRDRGVMQEIREALTRTNKKFKEG